MKEFINIFIILYSIIGLISMTITFMKQAPVDNININVKIAIITLLYTITLTFGIWWAI